MTSIHLFSYFVMFKCLFFSWSPFICILPAILITWLQTTKYKKNSFDTLTVAAGVKLSLIPWCTVRLKQPFAPHSAYSAVQWSAMQTDFFFYTACSSSLFIHTWKVMSFSATRNVTSACPSRSLVLDTFKMVLGAGWRWPSKSSNLYKRVP